MWCAQCQADVAGEVSADARSLLCTSCGTEVSSIKAPGPLPNTRGARDLLERWNTEDALDPYQPRSQRTGVKEATSASDPQPTGLEDDNADEKASDSVAAPKRPKRQRLRADAAHVEQDDAESESVEMAAASTKGPVVEREARVARRPSQRTFRVDDRHASADGRTAAHEPHDPRDVYESHGSRLDASHAGSPAPHFNIDAAFDRRRQPGRGESLWGQVLAYAGVGVLTVGTGLVVWGYFGGPESYTPTGWLLATAGQMLLFLGVVTLISGGMEQTTHEVSQRIERLGDHIIRIERHTAEQSLRGPHFATDQTSENDQPARRTDAAKV